MGDIWNMARLTLKQQIEIEQDNNWVRITFRSHYSQGTIVCKNKLYELQIKRLEKALKGLYYFVDYGYKPTYEEYCNMDSSLNSSKAHLRRCEYKYENTTNDYPVVRKALLDSIKNINNHILMREHELLEEYEEKFHD